MDFYKVLGVDNTATQEEIKKAYRLQAKMFHPDKFYNQSEAAKQLASEKMLNLNEAYEVLGNINKRKNYDNRSNTQNVNRQTQKEQPKTKPREPQPEPPKESCCKNHSKVKTKTHCHVCGMTFCKDCLGVFDSTICRGCIPKYHALHSQDVITQLLYLPIALAAGVPIVWLTHSWMNMFLFSLLILGVAHTLHRKDEWRHYDGQPPSPFSNILVKLIGYPIYYFRLFLTCLFEGLWSTPRLIKKHKAYSSFKEKVSQFEKVYKA